MQNLREAITGYRSRLTHESHEDKRNALLHVSVALGTVCPWRACRQVDPPSAAFAFSRRLLSDAFAEVHDAAMTWMEEMVVFPTLY